MQTPNVRTEISKLVILAASKFRIKSSNEFLGHVTNQLDDFCTRKKLLPIEAIAFVKEVLSGLPRKFDSFPSMRELDDVVEERYFFKRKTERKAKATEWVSIKAPGMPASVEALCIMIRDNVEHGIKAGLFFTGLTAEELWDIYLEWVEGRVHSKLEGFTDPQISWICNKISSNKTAA